MIAAWIVLGCLALAIIVCVVIAVAAAGDLVDLLVDAAGDDD